MSTEPRRRSRWTRPPAEIEAGRRALEAMPGADFARALLAQGLNYEQATARFGRVVIEVALAEHGYDKTAAGRQLHMTRNRVRRLARKTELQ
jgi:hypothetical protein